MFSIFTPEAALAPAVKKNIIYLSIAMIPCSICVWLLLLAFFLMNSPPVWGRWALPMALLVMMYLGGRIYSLRHPRQTSAHGISSFKLTTTTIHRASLISQLSSVYAHRTRAKI
jgi:hypothetical protein